MNGTTGKYLSGLKYRLLIVILLLAATGLKAQQTEFSGTWTRNTVKCDPGDLSINSIPVEVSITQNTIQIEINRISRNRAGDTSVYTETLKFDGTPALFVVKANLSKKASLQWVVDQKSFIEMAEYTDVQGKPDHKAKQNWSLTDGGKTLSIQSTLEIGGREFLLKEVYDRK
jgi:hypothetical protein